MRFVQFSISATLLLLPVLLAHAIDNGHKIKVLFHEVTVSAPVADVWQAWTTEAGAVTFFAPACHIEPRVDGAYEMYFAKDAEPGQRGGEGMRILAFEPNKMLAFSWNAPPSIPAIRKQRTFVSVKFQEVAPGKTYVTLAQTGWGDGEDWDQTYAYFDRAWGTIVLPLLRYRFEHGPVDWNNLPDLE